MDTIIVRYAEIGTKGKNRIFFEKKLVSNLVSLLDSQKIFYDTVRRFRGRIVVRLKDGKKRANLDLLFGASSYSYAYETDAAINNIKKKTNIFLGKFNQKTTFRVSTKRMNKSYTHTSTELNAIIGKYIVKKTNAQVSLNSFDKQIFIEVIEDKAYVFDKVCPGPGGLPVGSQGKVVCLVSSAKSILASLLIMRRGCEIIPVSNTKVRLYKSRYFHGHKIRIMTQQEIQTVMEKQNINAVAYGFSSSELYDLPQSHFPGTLCLFPLIGYNDDEIDLLMKRYNI
ncbi:hypothetical protein JW930_03730 [Candidatus Woesearchaeota archaeon]|nr:hypothetical protein [Candidatus Woesearchaeota archaeon]